MSENPFQRFVDESLANARADGLWAQMDGASEQAPGRPSVRTEAARLIRREVRYKVLPYLLDSLVVVASDISGIIREQEQQEAESSGGDGGEHAEGSGAGAD